jgi:DNA-binding protein HU-beta
MSKFTRARIRAILEAAGMERRRAAAATYQVISAITAALAAGEAVEIRGLGTLEVRERKARRAHNPRTLAPVEVPARRVVVFNPGRTLKTRLKGGPPMSRKTAGGCMGVF